MFDVEQQQEEFIRLLTAHQSRLYAFIFSLLADPNLVNDVFQETNVVLWRKAGEYDRDRDFLPWAFAIARNQVRAARQKIGRDRLCFDDQSMARIEEQVVRQIEQHDERLAALATCLEKLAPRQRELLDRRYKAIESIDEIAAATRRTANAVTVAIHRIRQALGKCIQSALAEASSA